jgi:uncharacterized protein (TIGR04255 family)
MVRKKYSNPPIKEVMFELRFSQSSPWDPTIPGLIYEKLKEQFPIREKGKDIETEIVVEEENIQPKVRLRERALFRNNEGNMLVQVGTHLLAINHLTPYTSWENYLKVIDQVLTAYVETVGTTAINRVELRHINEIPFIPNERVKLEDYFDFYPHIGFQLDNGFNSFIVGIQTEYGNDIQKIQMTNNQSNIILDTSYFSGKPNTIELSQVIQWLDIAHEKNNMAFEGSIKPPLRKQFGEVKSE